MKHELLVLPVLFILLGFGIVTTGPAEGKQAEIAPFNLNGKWGMKDRSGKIVTRPVYDEIAPFREFGSLTGAKVRRHGKWGCIDRTGKEIVHAKYDEIGDFFHTAIIAKVKLNGKWGYVDSTGREIIPPRYDEIGNFFQFPKMEHEKSESAAPPVPSKLETALRSYESYHSLNTDRFAVKANDKWGIIDKDGTVLVRPQYDKIRSFQDGMAAVKLRGLWGFIDEAGSEIVAPEYYVAKDFSEGMAAVAKAETGARELFLGFIDKSGREVVRPEYQAVGKFREGLAAVRTAGKDGKWTFIDKKGKKLFPPRYDVVWSFNEGLAPVNYGCPERFGTPDYDSLDLSNRDFFFVRRVNGKWGFIDKTGREVIRPKYNSVSPFLDGYALVSKMVTKPLLADGGGSYLVFPIDKRGKIDSTLTQRPPKTPSADTILRGNVLRVRLGEKWGYIGAEDAVFVPVRYDELPDFPRAIMNKFIRIKQNGKYGYLDWAGNEIVPAKYDEAPSYLYGKDDGLGTLAKVTVNGKYGYLARETGKEIIPPEFDDGPLAIYHERAKVKLNGAWGYIDPQGRKVSSFAVEDDPNAFVKKKGKHAVFGDQVSMRSKPDPASDIIALLSAGTTIRVGSKTDKEYSREDVSDMWYEAGYEGKQGYVWGGSIADFAYAAPVKGKTFLITVRNRTNASDHSYHKKFEMQLIADGKVASSLMHGHLSAATIKVDSMNYSSFDGFSAPLNLLVMHYEASNLKDDTFASLEGRLYLYIDDRKLTDVLDVERFLRGELKTACDAFIPDEKRGPDAVTVRCSGALLDGGISEEHYTWDWEKKTFVKAK